MIALALTLHLLITVTNSSPVEEAAAALTAGDPATALAALETALAADPQDVDALFAAAQLDRRLGNYARAATRLQTLLELDKANDDARLELARVLALAGEATQARTTVGELLDRHPQLTEALELRGQIDSGQPLRETSASLWHPQARAELGLIYDSNLALDPGTVPGVTARTASLMSIDLAGTLGYGGSTRPFTLVTRFVNQTGLKNNAKLADLLPTTINIGAIGQRAFGTLQASADARYQEFFTDGFSTHRQRLLAPSVWGALPVGSRQRVRVLAGVELRQPANQAAGPDNLTVKLGVRDQLSFGRAYLLLDVTARRNRESGKAPAAGSSSNDTSFGVAGFDELGGSLYGGLRFADDWTGFALAAAEARKLKAGTRESTYRGQLGTQYNLGESELYLVYGYTQNLSSPTRSYARHQVSGGVRVWFE